MGKGKKRNIKLAVILNAFAMPGMGHFYLGHKLRGVILSISCLFFIVTPAIKYVMQVNKALNTLVISLHDPAALEKMMQAPNLIWPDVRSIVITSIIGVLIVWVFGIVDILIMGKRQKDEEMSQDKAEKPELKIEDISVRRSEDGRKS